MKKLRFLFAFLILLSPIAASAQTNIDTVPAWNGTSFISSFGVTNTATYGQTITTALGTGAMTSFQFQIGQCTGGATVTFRGHVFAWDPATSRAVGPSLFNGPSTTISATDPGFIPVTINTGLLELPAGTYVIFVATSEDPQPNVSCRFGALTNDTTYAGGRFVFINNSTDTTLWTNNNWSNIAEDLAFRVNFVNGVPTLTAWATLLLIGGLAVVGVRGLRARQLAAARLRS